MHEQFFWDLIANSKGKNYHFSEKIPNENILTLPRLESDKATKVLIKNQFEFELSEGDLMLNLVNLDIKFLIFGWRANSLCDDCQLFWHFSFVSLLMFV